MIMNNLKELVGKKICIYYEQNSSSFSISGKLKSYTRHSLLLSDGECDSETFELMWVSRSAIVMITTEAIEEDEDEDDDE